MTASTGSVVVIGVFDGVHLGHQELLQRAARAAASFDPVLPVHALTFHPHPLSVVGAGAPPLICSIEERVRLLRAHGADHVDVIEFTAELAATEAEQFVAERIVAAHDARVVVVGENFRFGAGARGDRALLEREGAAHGFTLDSVELATGGLGKRRPGVVSSSRVRSLVTAGDIERVRELLGRPFTLSGEVVHGAGRGRELGFPTANLDVAVGLLMPAEGVYAGIAVRENGSRHVAAISVGTNPQFNGPAAVAVTVEAHLLDQDLDLYGEVLSVEFEHRVREQRVYRGVDELIEAIAEDTREVRRHMTAH